MKTNCVFLVIASLLLPVGAQVNLLPSALASVPMMQPNAVKQTRSSAYAPSHRGIPGRREGAGTR